MFIYSLYNKFIMNIKDYYKKSFNILKRNKKIILIIFVLYLVFLLGGTIYHNLTYEGFSSSEVRDAFFEDIKETILGDNFIDNFIEIFSNNIIASLFMVPNGHHWQAVLLLPISTA